MKASDFLTFGPTVLETFSKLKGRRAIEAMAGNKELTEVFNGVSEQKNALVKEHGTDGSISPDNENWGKFLEEYQDMIQTEIEIKSKFQFTDDDIEKLELDLATIQCLQKLEYYP